MFFSIKKLFFGILIIFPLILNAMKEKNQRRENNPQIIVEEEENYEVKPGDLVVDPQTMINFANYINLNNYLNKSSEEEINKAINLIIKYKGINETENNRIINLDKNDKIKFLAEELISANLDSKILTAKNDESYKLFKNPNSFSEDLEILLLYNVKKPNKEFIKNNIVNKQCSECNEPMNPKSQEIICFKKCEHISHEECVREEWIRNYPNIGYCPQCEKINLENHEQGQTSQNIISNQEIVEQPFEHSPQHLDESIGRKDEIFEQFKSPQHINSIQRSKSTLVGIGRKDEERLDQSPFIRRANSLVGFSKRFLSTSSPGRFLKKSKSIKDIPKYISKSFDSLKSFISLGKGKSSKKSPKKGKSNKKDEINSDDEHY